MKAIAIITLILVVLFFAFLYLTIPAGAHTEWADGSPVKKNLQNPTTKELCCGDSDCHMIESRRVTFDGSNYVLDLRGAWVLPPPPSSYADPAKYYESRNPPKDLVLYPASQVMPSPDGKIWGCYWQQQMKCFFMPFGV